MYLQQFSQVISTTMSTATSEVLSGVTPVTLDVLSAGLNSCVGDLSSLIVQPNGLQCRVAVVDKADLAVDRAWG